MTQRQFRSNDTSPWNEKFGNGSDGAASINTSTDATPNTTLSALINATAATVGLGTGFVAGNLILIHQSRNGGTGVGLWELNKIASIGAGTNWTLTYPTMNAYDTTAQVYLLKQYSSAIINSGQTLTIPAYNGTQGAIFPILCNGTVRIDGSIFAAGKGFRGTSFVSTNDRGQTGEGSGGPAGSQSKAANGNGGGGGDNPSGGGIGAGGSGGGIVAGQSGYVEGGGGPHGDGGNAVGNIDGTLISLGGGGGGEAGGSSGLGGPAISGNGGGLIFIIAKNVIVTSPVNANGSQATGIQSEQGSSRTFTGSGGGGGFILIKCQTAVLGSGLLSATGGPSLYAGGSQHFSGKAGGDGGIHVDYLVSVSGITSPAFDSRQDSGLVDSAGGSFLFTSL